jgi:aspartate/methionine/tyrosine aminotransferase
VRSPIILTRWLVRAGLARWLPRARAALGSGVESLRYCSDEALRLPVEALQRAAAAVTATGPDVLDLSQGPDAGKNLRVPVHGPALENTSWASIVGSWDLRCAVSQWMQHELRITRDAQHEVLITQGATGALQLALATFVNPGDRVVVFAPTSPLFEILAAARGARIERIPARLEEGRLRFGVDRLATALRGARLILLANPTNPQGGLLCDADLEQIAWWAAKRDVLLYSDDTFASLFHDKAPTNLACFPRTFGRTLSAGSVSKSHAQPGLRVGWLSADRALLRASFGIAAARTSFVPGICQQAALGLFEQPAEKQSRLREQLAGRRQYVYERLQTMGFRPDWPAGGHFFWLETSPFGMSGSEFADRLFRDKRVRVSPGVLFGPCGTHHIRLSYATEDGRLRMALGKMADFLAEQKTGTLQAA